MDTIRKTFFSITGIFACCIVLLAAVIYLQGHHGFGIALAALPLMIPVSEALVWIIGIDAAFVYFGYLLVTWFQANPLF